MSLAAAMRPRVEERSAKDSRIQWPSAAWRGRHLEFARDVMGKRTIAQHQVKILNEYYKPSIILAVVIFIVACTGQKLGKTETMIIAAAFDFATEPKLNGFVFGPKLEHTNEVFWPRFVLDMLAAYYPCAECMPAHRSWCAIVETNPYDTTPRPDRCSNCSPLIPSRLKNPKDVREGRVSEWLDDKRSEGGLHAPDSRAIRGYVSRKEGGKGGFSGCVRFYIDEASDVTETDKATVDGNLSGGGKAIAFGNMLYNHGWFYRACKNEQKNYSFVFQLSSRYSPNCPGVTHWSDGETTANDNAGRPVPGMATREGIERNLVQWRGTNLIAARIDAKPPAIVEGQLANSQRVLDAEKRWTSAIDGTGILQIGVDVARMRDKLAIAIRRGNKIVELFAEALGEEDHSRGVALALSFAKKYRRPGEDKPRFVYDASGIEGDKFTKELAAQYASNDVELYPVQMTFKPRNTKLYRQRRDELAYNFVEWLRLGAIPADADLEAEIEATTAKAVDFSWNGHTWKVQRVIDNDELRPILGRSPDKRNACELVTWSVVADEVQSAANDVMIAENAATTVEKTNVVPIKTRKKQRREAADDDEEIQAEPWGAADAGLRSAWGQS